MKGGVSELVFFKGFQRWAVPANCADKRVIPPNHAQVIIDKLIGYSYYFRWIIR